MNAKRIFIPDEKSMLEFGALLAKNTKPGDIIFLKGQLGAGKTTLARGFLRAFNYSGIVKSPTYTLVEPYSLKNLILYHFDLYRLTRVEELDEIGLSDYLTEDAICLIEWPEKGMQRLPDPTVCCTIEIPENGDGRWAFLEWNDVEKVYSF